MNENPSGMRPSLILPITLSGLLYAFPTQGFSQEVNTKPAISEELNTYTGMGAVNICTLNGLGISFDKSLQASVQMFLSVLDGRHGGAIQGIEGGKKLTEKVLINGGVFETILKVDGICGKDFAGENKKLLEKLKADIKKAATTQSTPTPTPTPTK